MLDPRLPSLLRGRGTGAVLGPSLGWEGSLLNKQDISEGQFHGAEVLFLF